MENVIPRTESLSMFVAIERVIPDANQPREYFAADKLFQLKESIRNHGIITPLNVMRQDDETFLLLDGERRFRAAKELGLKEVPVIIENPMSDEDRLIRQFQIQEFHESWTQLEKAKAIIALSENMGMKLLETCKMLGISPRNTRTYMAFAGLADKKAYVESETPLQYTESIGALKAAIRRVADKDLSTDITIGEEKEIERKIISMVKVGTIRKPVQITKILDAVKKEPKLIAKLTDPTAIVESPEQLFRETGAKGAHALRQVVYSSRYITQYINTFMAERDVKISAEEFDVMIRARDALNKLIDIA